MKQYFISFVLFLFITIINCSINHHVFKENASLSMRYDLIKMHRVDNSIEHTVIFAINQLRTKELELTLMNISDPRNPYYGQYWTNDEISLFTQNLPGRDAIRRFLFHQKIDIDHETVYGENITATAAIHKWESIFNTHFHYYHMKDIFKDNDNTHYTNEDKLIIRTDSYSLPLEIAHHVSVVFNTIQFPYPAHQKGRNMYDATDDENKLITTEGGDGRKGYITQINNDGRVLTNQKVHRLNKSQTIVVVISIMLGTAIFLYGLYRFEH